MKALFFFLLAVFGAKTVFADSIVSSQKLQIADSTRLYNALGKLEHSAQPDASDPSLIVQKSGFSSSDGAFKIKCSKKFRVVDLGTECEVNIDSTLSQNGISSVTIGVIGEVRIINLFADLDIKSLQRSVASPLGYFQSSETVQVKLLDGKLSTFPKLRIDCQSTAEICQIALFP